MSVIYEPKGAAREYSELACNIYSGCLHGCKYCYAPACLRKKPDEFHASSTPRSEILKQLEKDCEKLRGDPREVLFCFTTDPYQPNETGLTREALLIMERYEMRCQVLTKGGMRAERDFDIIARNGWKFGTTLLFSKQESADEWEPNAAKIESRMNAVRLAHEAGIHTWVSVEPVIDPEQAIEVINSLLPFVSFWKVGKLNHNKAVEEKVDWKKFVHDVEHVLKNRPHMIKEDLAKWK